MEVDINFFQLGVFVAMVVSLITFTMSLLVTTSKERFVYSLIAMVTAGLPAFYFFILLGKGAEAEEGIETWKTAFMAILYLVIIIISLVVMNIKKRIL